MDMVLANLFKHKMSFKMGFVRYIAEHNSEYSTFYRNYISKRIKNLRDIGVTDINELRTKCLEPFIVYIISQIVVEETEHIERISVVVALGEDNLIADLHNDFHAMCGVELYNPKRYLHELSLNNEMITEPIEKRLSDKPFFFNVIVHFLIPTPLNREIEEPYTPPIETYRQDCCVVCLESKPNILYLDCMHIAICDSCDRLKKTHRKNCDVCRAEISKRIKI